ncbi:MAG TPA: asparagine synthetase B [Spirochaetota bacterium]|nr:asparagine synthetase B [Spirochaetota bacterium]
MLFLIIPLNASYLLLPMDDSQSDHLKAYGITYLALKAGLKCKWLLNYRCGSFLIPLNETVKKTAVKRGVTVKTISASEYARIKIHIESRNAAAIKLEKAPRVAIYTPLNKAPWADAVTLVMQYAQIPYDKIYDQAVLSGELAKYDWLHLHHEDFTGQYSKFWATYRYSTWFQKEQATFNKAAEEAGFPDVPSHKLAVAQTIKKYVKQGLFLFAMCTATETIDIALAAHNTDIVPPELDGDSWDKDWAAKMDYGNTFAFEGFTINPNPYINSFSDIDYNQVNTRRKIEVSDFILFEFSAKFDPIPTLLCQCHRNRINGFYGQTTTFNRDKIKDGVITLAKSINKSVRYLHGNMGEGTFTFYGGHAPEDKNHFVGDKEPNMELYKNSPGYRLILNNILFPSAKPPQQKT